MENPDIIIQSRKKKISNKRVLLCGIGKLENNYVREWVEHHKKMGITNIVLYDNNDINGEYFTEVIGDYVRSGYVIIENWRGRTLAQVPSYNDCYNKYKGQYDWIGFWDLDEFIEFDGYENIQQFLGDKKFNETQCVRLCWKQYTDNDLLGDDGNYSVTKFTEVFDEEFCKKNGIKFDIYRSTNVQCKSIYRTNVHNFKVTSPHCFMKNIKALNANGVQCWNSCVNIGNNVVWECAWLNHYRFKTISEYISRKMVRLWPTEYGNGGKDMLNLDFFFKFNKKTEEKVIFAENMMKERSGRASEMVPMPIIEQPITQEKKEVAVMPVVAPKPIIEQPKVVVEPPFNGIRVSCWTKKDNNGELVHRNWGDELNYYLLPLMFNREVVGVKNNSGKENYACIGSVLTDAFIDKDTIIWGAGTQNTGIKLKKKPKKVLAVRGPLSRQFLLDSGIDCPEVYGDPALLLPNYYFPQVDKKYKIGFIPHWESIDSPNAKEFASRKGVHLIKMKGYDKWTDVIDEILASEYVVSESLHGLIVAEAYGIPNIWVNVALNKYEVKFHDFFLSTGLDRIRAINITPDVSTDILDIYANNYRPGHIDLEPLMKACPFTVYDTRAGKPTNSFVG